MTTHVRPATAGDVPALVELCRELDETHRREHPELFSASVVREPESLERRLFDPRAGCFVAEFAAQGGVVLSGFVRVVEVPTPDGGVLLSRRYALVDELVVALPFRRAGVAGRLLESAETWAAARGIEALEVVVWEFNRPAHDLYEQHGYASLRRYYRKPIRAT